MTDTKNGIIEVLTGPERRRRWFLAERQAMVQESPMSRLESQAPCRARVESRGD